MPSFVRTLQLITGLVCENFDVRMNNFLPVAGRNSTIPFPCQFRQNENELCQDENQDRVNEFHCRFREKMFRQYETEFCLKENDC